MNVVLSNAIRLAMLPLLWLGYALITVGFVVCYGRKLARATIARITSKWSKASP